LKETTVVTAELHGFHSLFQKGMREAVEP